jgi:hypothetical protein
MSTKTLGHKGRRDEPATEDTEITKGFYAR